MPELFGEQQEQEVALIEPSVPRATLDDGTVIEPREEGKLEPGSHARIFRDGQILEGIVLVPQKGALSLRHLAPGSYVLRDESGNEVAVRVGALEEDAVVQTKGGPPELEDGTAEPGSAVVLTTDVERDTRAYDPLATPAFPNVGPTETEEVRSDGGDLIRPSLPSRRKAKVDDVEADEPVVPAEPGSALITPEVATTLEEELPEDAQKGVVTEPTDQGDDPALEHLAPTPFEERLAETQRNEITGGPIDPAAHTKDELRDLAREQGVPQAGTKDEVAARINADRASK